MILPIKRSTSQAGFTLIELIVVIAVLAILFAITLVAVNPARQFALARDAQRRSDVNAILNAIHQYAAGNNGTLPAAITTTPTVIGSGATQVNICSLLVATYIAAMPFDPSPSSGGNYTDCTNYNSGYSVSRSAANNRVTVTATPEITPPATISVTR